MGFRSSRGRRLPLAVLLMLLTLFAGASAASAAVQTVTDPDDDLEMGTESSFDIHKVILDTDSSPGNLRLTLELDFAPGRGISGAVLFDTDRDGRTDRSLYITGVEGASKHPELDGTDGQTRSRLKPISSSTDECQVFNEVNDRWWWDPALHTFTPITLRSTTGVAESVMTYTIPLADLGNPAALNWAVVGETYKMGPRYDYAPDTADGRTGGIGPVQRGIAPEPGAYCSPEDQGSASGWLARMPQGGLLQISDNLPEPTIAQTPPMARPGDTVSFAVGTKDNRPLSAIAWDLDRDGEYDDATGATASRRFESGGTRFVGVRVTDTAGKVGTAEKTVVITDRAPVVTIGQNPALARPNRPVALVANITDDGASTTATWDLDGNGTFGDATGASITHTFTTSANHTVRVLVTDDAGNETIQTKVIEVADRAPTITLRSTHATAAAKEKFTLTADVVDDGDYRIDWGVNLNGNDALDPYNAATGKTWTLSWGWPGDYRMKARVTDDSGKTATAEILVKVPNAPATFREIRAFKKVTPYNPYNTEPLVKNQTITLQTLLYDDNSTRPKVEWDLDDNGSYDDATGEQIDHVFTTGGTKNVKVRIEDQAGAVTLGRTTFEVREAADAGCAGKVTENLMRLQGCWTTKPDGTKVTKEPIKMNGLDIKPLEGATLNYTPVGGILFTTGQGKVRISTGGTVLFEGQFEMDPKCNPKATECLVGKWSVPKLAELKGLPLKGEAEVWFTPKGTRVKVNVDVLGTIGLGVTAKADLIVNDETGLQLNDLELRSPMIPIKQFEIGQFWLKYEGAYKRWSGGGHIVLPTPQFTKLSADFQFNEKYGFERARGEIDGLNVPVDPFASIWLQRIAFTMEIKGLDGNGSPRVRLGGGLGASFGPRIADVDAATVDGDFLITFGWPLGIDVEGRISVAGFDVMGGWVSARSNGSVDASGFIGFGLPFPSALKGQRKDATKVKVQRISPSGADVYDPYFQVVTLKGEARGWIEPRSMNFEAGVYAKVLGITLAEAEGLMSTKGVAGCGEIIGIRGGFGHNWEQNKTDLFGKSCDIGNYRPLREFEPEDKNGAGRAPGFAAARAAQAAPADGVTTFDVAKDAKALVLKLKGQGGDPTASLVAPSGRSYDVRADMDPVQTDDFYAAKNTTAAGETYVGIRAPEAGRWTLKLAEGSVPLAGVEQAGILPTPSVKATVRGSGLKRTIDYDIKTIPGQTVDFVEDGSDTHWTAGTVKGGGKGSLTFTPQNGRGMKRKLVAVVKQDGMTREHVALGTFLAPALQRPGSPQKLRARRGPGGRLTVAWDAVPGADKYHVVAKMSDGSSAFVPTSRTSAVLRGVQSKSIVRLNVWSLRNGAEKSLRSTLRIARYQAVAPRRALVQKRRGAVKPRFTG